MAEAADDEGGGASVTSSPRARVVDLRGASFEAIVRFVFDHPPTEEGGRDWYFAEDLEIVVAPDAARGVARDATGVARGAAPRRAPLSP